MLKSRKSRIVLSTMLVAILVGSVVAAVFSHTSRARVVDAGGVKVLVGPRALSFWGRDVAEVGLGGQLALVENACLGLASDNLKQAAIVVWPHGTKVVGKGADLEVHINGQTRRIGDALDAGGPAGAGSKEELEFFNSRIPTECEGHPFLRVSELRES